LKRRGKLALAATSIAQSGAIQLVCLLIGLFAAVPLLAQPAVPPTDESPADCRERLEQMSPLEKETLRQKKQRFDSLTPEEQQRLRSLHAQLTSHADGEQLAQVAARYAQWLRTLSPGQRAELLALDPEKRLERIRRFKEEQQAERMGELFRAQLKPEDIREIHAWLGRYAKTHEPELMALVGSETQQHLRRIPDGFPRQFALFRALQRRPRGEPLPQPTAEELEDLSGRLSAEARQLFDSVAEEGQKLTLVLQWIRAAAMTRFMPPPVPSEELERFFAEELDSQQREFLEQKPREEFQQELRRMYWMRNFRGREGDFRSWPFHRGDGRPPHHRNGDGPSRGGGARGPYRDRGRGEFRPEGQQEPGRAPQQDPGPPRESLGEVPG
jgi:hypothetical protein